MNSNTGFEDVIEIRDKESFSDIDVFAEMSTSSDVQKPKAFFLLIKRVFDILFSALIIIIGIVPSLILSLIIAIESKGSPIYTQERVGQHGKLIKIFKFRSMVVDADNVEKYLSKEQLSEWNNERKVEDDPRITRTGRFIRKTSIDELPQFINVLISQMSIIGVRPVVEAELKAYRPYGELGHCLNALAA